MNNLPKWDLSPLYLGIEDNNISQDIEILEKKTKDFAKNYNGFISDMHADGLYIAISEYEIIENISTKLYTFAFLQYVTDLTNENVVAFLQKIKDKLTDISTNLTFFSLQINNLSDEDFDKLIKQDGKISQYVDYLKNIRRFKKHNLSNEIENLIINKDSSGISQIIRLFDEHSARLKFNIDGKSLNLSAAIELLSSGSGDMRKNAAGEISKVFGENAWFYGIILNTVAKDKSIDDNLRYYKSPISSRNLSNFIEDDVVECLINSVKSRYPQISHRYYKLKAKLMNKEFLEYYDRNAPISVADDKIFTFDQAREIVLDSYYGFNEEIGKIVESFFANKLIDAEPSPFKMSGAFCHPNATEHNPYIMLNYFGKTRDVSTMAHELGHGVHMQLSRKCGQLMQHAPLTLAETASLFGEQLVFERLLKTSISDKEKIAILSNKIEDSINTVIRQISFCDFENTIHKERARGELTTSKISSIWLETQRDSLGEYVKLSNEYSNYWCYVSHFIHAPFYVYSYAFGNLLVNSLYNCYKNEKVQNFSTKYIELLSSGGKVHHSDALKPFGLNAKDQDFWLSGLSLIEKLIDDLEFIVNKNENRV